MKKQLFLWIALFTIIFTCGFTEGQKVYDKAGLLTAKQITTLEAKAISIAKEKSVDIIILTTDNADGKTSEAYADDFYDNNAFGYEREHGTGILLLIDMDNRNAWISTSGEAITYFTDERIELALDSIFEYLPNAQYYESCNVFLDKVTEYMGNLASDSNVYYDAEGKYHSDGTYDTQGNYKEYTAMDRFKQNIWIYILISVAVGAIGAGIMAINSGGRITVSSGTYIDKSSIKVNRTQDQFIRTTVTKRKIETQSSGGGGSSTHTSSGGDTHGGGGRSF